MAWRSLEAFPQACNQMPERNRTGTSRFCLFIMQKIVTSGQPDRRVPDMATEPAAAISSPGEVLQLIRDGRASTRSEVMDITGLSRSTVMHRLGVLLAAGLLREGPGSGRSSGGRPPTSLAFNEQVGVVLAADLGARHGRLAVCDLAGEPLAEREDALRIADGPGPVLGWLGERFDDLLTEAGRARADVLAMGIGVPGPVEMATGRPVSPLIMPGWDGHPVAAELGGRFRAPALLERDVNAMALGEHRRHWPLLRHLLFVKVATGIGAGIISDGQLLRGGHGRAGDIGHIRAITPSDVLCTCGNRGCVGALASGSAIVRQLQETGVEAASSADVVALVEAGHAEATHRVREAGRLLGAALAAVVAVVAPTVVVIGGELAEASEPLLAGIRESVYQRSSPRATQQLRILTSGLGARAGVVGATTLALEHVLQPASVDALLARRGVAA
jgi:predicted NBD/HSP70 family sugar kinase